jgi:hypothetical protein
MLFSYMHVLSLAAHGRQRRKCMVSECACMHQCLLAPLTVLLQCYNKNSHVHPKVMLVCIRLGPIATGRGT